MSIKDEYQNAPLTQLETEYQRVSHLCDAMHRNGSSSDSSPLAAALDERRAILNSLIIQKWQEASHV